MVNGKYIFNVQWPTSAGLIEGFCTVCEQPWVDLNPRPFALKATALTTAPRRPHNQKESESLPCRKLPLELDVRSFLYARQGKLSPLPLPFLIFPCGLNFLSLMVIGKAPANLSKLLAMHSSNWRLKWHATVCERISTLNWQWSRKYAWTDQNVNLWRN